MEINCTSLIWKSQHVAQPKKKREKSSSRYFFSYLFSSWKSSSSPPSARIFTFLNRRCFSPLFRSLTTITRDFALCCASAKKPFFNFVAVACEFRWKTCRVITFDEASKKFETLGIIIHDVEEKFDDRFGTLDSFVRVLFANVSANSWSLERAEHSTFNPVWRSLNCCIIASLTAAHIRAAELRWILTVGLGGGARTKGRRNTFTWSSS